MPRVAVRTGNIAKVQGPNFLQNLGSQADGLNAAMQTSRDWLQFDLGLMEMSDKMGKERKEGAYFIEELRKMGMDDESLERLEGAPLDIQKQVYGERIETQRVKEFLHESDSVFRQVEAVDPEFAAQIEEELARKFTSPSQAAKRLGAKLEEIQTSQAALEATSMLLAQVKGMVGEMPVGAIVKDPRALLFGNKVQGLIELQTKFPGEEILSFSKLTKLADEWADAQLPEEQVIRLKQEGAEETWASMKEEFMTDDDGDPVSPGDTGDTGDAGDTGDTGDTGGIQVHPGFDSVDPIPYVENEGVVPGVTTPGIVATGRTPAAQPRPGETQIGGPAGTVAAIDEGMRRKDRPGDTAPEPTGVFAGPGERPRGKPSDPEGAVKGSTEKYGIPMREPSDTIVRQFNSHYGSTIPMFTSVARDESLPIQDRVDAAYKAHVKKKGAEDAWRTYARNGTHPWMGSLLPPQDYKDVPNDIALSTARDLIKDMPDFTEESKAGAWLVEQMLRKKVRISKEELIAALRTPGRE